MTVEPFNRLVKLAARAFYDDITTKGDNQPEKGRSDNRGIAVVLLDALTRRQWVREEDLAKDLKLHSKQLPGFCICERGLNQFGFQIYDVVSYRLHRLRKKLKDELENKNAVQEYICPNCGRRYNALDALRLISPADEYFHCENCNGELVAESDKLAAQEGGDGDDNARRRRREKLKDMLQKMEVQLKPLMDQLSRVKDLPVLEFGSLQAWEARASAAGRPANGDSSSNDPSKSSQGLGFGRTPMTFIGETKVEVAFSGVEGKEEDVKSETASSGLKVLPPWMIKQGMNLTKEQRGEVKQESKMDGSVAAEFSDSKKPTNDNVDNKTLQDEYVKAYYAALLNKQQELEEASKKQEKELSNGISESLSTRNTGESYKVNDLNVEAEASGEEEEEEDDIDWEEG
ncbi:hypothetical protein P3X46_002784 [Hevea brasiliensis]|uniref:HTH TFE/IIEalpha-type domain-containing protein n=1 Tax=Hevea brasiliensis TaxID=3981 RepID=A0ABQ9N7W5_HEVBR|nr:hypothetical protein P3X46_002784 [Hevea brasiliensis]